MRKTDADANSGHRQLFASDDLYTPLAHFFKSAETLKSELHVSERAAHMLDVIVVALLVVIQKGRMDVKNLSVSGGMMKFYSRDIQMVGGGV